MKMQIQGRVRYGDDALAAVLGIAGVNVDIGEVDRELTYTGRRGTHGEGLYLQKENDWLSVTFSASELSAIRLQNYFRDVRSFNGSNMALAASMKVRPHEVARMY